MYNKNEFNKTNDKKVLHKVKKQWVTISVSMFAALGAAGITIYNAPNAEADTVNTNQETITNNDNLKHDGNQVISNTTNNNNNGKSLPSTSNYSNNHEDEQSAKIADDHNVQNVSNNNGHVDSEPKASNVTSGHDSAASDSGSQGSASAQGSHSSAANSGSSKAPASGSPESKATVSASSVHNSAASNEEQHGSSGTPSSGTSTTEQAPSFHISDGMLKNLDENSLASFFSQQFTASNPNALDDEQKQAAINGAVAAWNAIHFDDQQTVNSNVDKYNRYYQSGYQGVQDAWKTYNSLNGSLGTQSVKSYNDNNASNPNDPKSVDPNLNSQKHSITNTTQNVQAVNDPLAKTQNVNVVSPSGDKVFVNSGVQAPIDMDSYNWGVNYFLKEQGTYDAETGRWSADPNGSDVYRPSENSDNAYDQSYLGAKDAISQQFKADDTFNYNVNSPSTFAPKMSITAPSDDYQLGFNDVITKVKNGTAFVTNAIQINNSIDTQNQKTSTQSQSLPAQGATIQSNNSIKDIRFMNDIDFQPTNYAATINNNTYVYIQPTGSSYNLTFDGQNHVTDFQGLTYSLDPAGSPDHNSNNLTVKNFATAYGANYWGMAKVENQYATLHVSNLTYVGGQFTSSANGWVDISGNVNLFSLGVYRSPFNDYNVTNESSYWSNSGINNGSTQENIEAANLNIQSGANFYGSTTGGTSLAIGHDTNISGMGGNNLVVGQDANVELVPFYNAVKPNTGAYGDTTDGIFLNGNNSGNFIVKKNANVIINAKGNSYVAKPLYITNAQTIIDGGNVTINMNGSVNSGNANYLGGGQTSPWIPNSYTAGLITNGGSLIVNADDLNGVTNSVNGGTYSSSSYNGDIIYNYYSLFVNKGGNFKVTTDGSGNNPTLLYSGNGLYLDSTGNVNLQVGNNGIINQEPIYAYNTAYAINSNGVSQQHYEIYVPKSNSGNISYDANGGMTTSNDNITNAQSLTFQQANPTGYFNGPIEVQQNADKSNVLTGTFKLNNLSSTNNGNINLQINIDGKRIDPSILRNGKFILLDQNGNVISNVNDTGSNISVPNQVVSVGNSNSANPTFSYGNVPYDDSILIPQNAQNGDQIVFYYELPKGMPNSTVQVNANYFNNIETQTLTKNNDGSANVSDALNNPLYGNDPIDNTTLQKFVKSPYEPSDIDAENDAIADAIDNVSNNKTNFNDYHNGKNWYKYQSYPQGGQYKVYYNDAYNGYLKGKSDYQANSNIYDQAQLTYSLNNTFAMQQGYNAVYNDVSNGFTDRVVNNNINNSHANNDMYTLGFDYGSGALDAMQNNKSASTDAGYGIGYHNLIDGMQNNSDNTSLSYQFNPAYQYGAQMMQGYQDADNQLPVRSEQGFDLDAYQNGQAFYDGLNDVIKNVDNPTSYTFINNQNIYYNLAQNLFSNGLKTVNNYVLNQNNLNQIAFDTGIDARNGIEDASSNNSNRLNSYSGIQSQAYQNAQAAFYDGSSGINNSNNAGLNPYANQVGQAAYNGTGDALSGNNNQSQYTDSLQQTAYQNAQLAFSAISSGSVNDSGKGKLNAYASQVGQAAQDGLNSIINGLPDDSKNYAKYATSYQQQAYENARLAYSTGQLNKDNSSATAQLNLFANNAGINSYNGLNDALNGIKNIPNNNDFNIRAYNNAQNDYNAGLQNISGNNITDITAWNAGQAAYQAIIDQVAGNSNGANGYTNGSQSQAAYNNAWTAYSLGSTSNNSADSNAKKNIRANQVGLQAYNGLNDAINNKPKQYFANDSLMQAAYDNTRTSYQRGQLGDNKSKEANYNVLANKAGSASLSGLVDAVAGYNKSVNYNEFNMQAYTKAQESYAAGQNNLTNPNVYDAAYEAGLVSHKRLDQIVYGDNNHYKDFVKPSDSLQSQAYENAQTIYVSGQNGNFGGLDTNQLPYKAGIAYSVGIQDSLANNHKANEKRYTDIPLQAYENALTDFAKQVSGQADDSNKAAIDGMMDAVSGNNVYYNQHFDIYYKNNSNLNNIYNKSKENFIQGSKNSVKNGGYEPSYNAGVAAYNGLQAILRNAASNFPPDAVQSKAYISAQEAYRQGYNGNISGYNDKSKPNYTYNYANSVGYAVNQAMQAVLNKNSQLNPSQSNPYIDADLQATYNNALDAYNNGLNNNDKYDLNNNNYNYLANQVGLSAYQGLSDVINGVSDAYSNQQSSSFNQVSYENARTAYSLGQKNQSTNYNNAANAAGFAAYYALNDIINNGTANNSEHYSGLEKEAYDNTVTAYNAGFNGNDNQLNQEAHSVGLVAKSGLNDAILGNADNSNNYFSDSFQNSAYKNAYQAYFNGVQGNTSNKNSTANDIGLAVKRAISDDLGENKNINPYSASNNKQLYDAYNNAYNAANRGYYYGDTTDTEAKANAIANISGYAANQALADSLAGNSDQHSKITNDNNVIQNVAQTTYINAYQSYNAGFNGDQSSAIAMEDKRANKLGAIANTRLSNLVRGDDSIPIDYVVGSPEYNLYLNIQKAYLAGVRDKNSNSDDPNAKLSNMANQAGLATYQALDDSVKGKAENTLIYSSNQFAQNAYNNTRKAYLMGMLGNKNSSDALLNKAANTAGLAALNGLNDAIIGKPNNDQAYQNGFIRQAYQNAQKSYQAGKSFKYSGNDMDPNITNIIAYDSGLSAYNGLNDAINGNTDNLSKSNFAEYENARQAYLDGIKGNSVSEYAKMDAYSNQVGLSAYSGLNDGINDNNDHQPIDITSAAYRAYQVANLAYNNGLAGKTNTNNLIANAAGFAYNNALNDAINGDTNNQPSDASSPAGIVYNNIYQAYNNGANGIKIIGYGSYANSVGLAAYDGLNDIVNGNGKRTDGLDSKQLATYLRAQTSFNVGLNSTSQNSNQLNQFAYQAGQAAKSGINDSVNDNSNRVNSYSNLMLQNAYANARQAYNLGQKNIVDKRFNITANQAGLASYVGLTDLVYHLDHKEDYSSNLIQMTAYKLAQRLYQSGLEGNNESSLLANEIGLMARTGLLNAINNNPAPKFENALFEVAYNKAQQAYQAGQNNNQTAQNQQMAMLNKVANNAGLASYVGLQDAINNNSDHEQNYRNDLVQFQAYINAQRMYQAGQSGHQDNHDSESNQVGIASKAGLTDAINGVPDNQAKYPDNPNQQKAYENARAAYQAGVMGDTNSAQAKLDASANQAGWAVWMNTKNNHGNKQPITPTPKPTPAPTPMPNPIPSDNNQTMPTPPSKRPITNDDGFKAGINAFANGRQPSLIGKSAAYINNFYRGYDEAKQGFDAKQHAMLSNNMAYNDGHRNFHDYQKGIFDAKHHYQSRLNGNYAYKVGHQAYQAGSSGIVIDYQRIDKEYRAAYKYAYNLAYKKRLHDIPHYVYNYNTIYSYKVLKFNNKRNRLVKYRKLARNKRHIFKVVGFRMTANGHLFYHLIGGGWITSDAHYIDDAYYRKNKPAAKNTFKVIKPIGTYVYNSRKFNNRTMVRHLKRGDTFHVKYIETYGKMTRMYLGNGEYISSNKTIVERVK